MFDRFTERARKVMSLSRHEALRFGHDYIGTEHILLGLLLEGSGVAAQVLCNLDVEQGKIRSEVEKLVGQGTNMVTQGQLPFTPRAKTVLELSLEEAQYLGHCYIGTEHLLLGLVREKKGIAARVLLELGVNADEVRDEIIELLGVDPDADGKRADAPPDRRPKAGATSDAQRALRSAGEESVARRHGFVGTEHLLLGVVAGDDETARALHEAGATASAARLAVDELRAPGESEGQWFSISARRALDRAQDEALDLGHTSVDSRHLALALLAVSEGLAATVLRRLVPSPKSLIERLRALPPGM